MPDKIETPSYMEFMLMDNKHLDPVDVAEVKDICNVEEARNGFGDGRSSDSEE